MGEPGLDAFLSSGRRVADELLRLLAGTGRSLDGVGHALDFGCGCGRVLRFLRADCPDLQISGAEVDSDAIAWLRQASPAGTFVASSPRPPLDLADDSFDLIYAISVFTHLPEDAQTAWLRELDRVLAPGGLGILTVHGPAVWDTFLEGRRPGVDARELHRLRELSPLEEVGYVFEPYSVPHAGDEFPQRGGDPYGLAAHSSAYIRERWSDVFEILDIVPASINWRQDAVLVTPKR